MTSESIIIDQEPRCYHVRYKFKEKLEWATVNLGNYDNVISAAFVAFPELVGQKIEIFDTEGAAIRKDFIETFLNFSPKGVILSIKNASDLEAPDPSLPGPSTFTSSSSSFSTYSKAYTGGTGSCSTETLYNLSASSNSPTNFDESDNESYQIPKKKLKTASVDYSQITDKVLKNYILSHPRGREVVAFYKEYKTLDDSNRKRLVNIVVDHMLNYMPPGLLPSHETKTDYAKTLTRLFPKLRDPKSKTGFEAFYDPMTKKGWLTTRIRNLARDKKSFKITDDKVITDKTENEVHDCMDDVITFLKFCTQDQRDEIFEKTKETFHLRNKNRENLISLFPRFLDTNGLISLEFHLMYPTTAEKSFVDIFPKYIGAIRNVYKRTITRPDPTLIRDSVDSSDEWDSTTKAIITLVHLLPPTSSKKFKKESAANAIDKLIFFQFSQVPLQNILETRSTRQPFILAVGTSRAAVSSYYIIFDNHIIPSPKPDILTAFDTLFQIHFVFNLKFDKSLSYFFNFMQIQFYNINVENISLTSRMRDIRTKIINQLESESESLEA